MLHKVLPVIVNKLNAFLQQVTDDEEDRVLLSSIVDQSGNLAFTGTDLVICTVIGIEQERTVMPLRNPSGRISMQRAPVYLNVQLLFSAYFPGNYTEALKYISFVIDFFQANPVFTRQNKPVLPKEVEKLTVELSQLDQQVQFQLWHAMGAKMMPSIVMKVRMSGSDREQILAEIPEITRIDSSVSGRPKN